MIRVTKRRANGRRKEKLEFDVRKSSRVLALSPARSGTRVGSDTTCVKSLTTEKASASRPAELVTVEE